VDVSLIKHAATKETILPMIFTTVDKNDEEYNARWVCNRRISVLSDFYLLTSHLISANLKMPEPKSIPSIEMPMVKYGFQACFKIISAFINVTLM
jgi:hypothetical protein